MHLEVEKATEEVQTGLFLPGAAIADGFVHELFGFEHLLELDLLVDIVASERVRVGSNDGDDLETVRVFVRWILFPSLCEEFACHQVILMVHPQNTLAKPLVVNCSCVDLTILIHFPDIILSNLVLLNRDISVGSEEQDLMNQVVLVHLVRQALLLCFDCNCLFVLDLIFVFVSTIFTLLVLLFVFIFVFID